MTRFFNKKAAAWLLSLVLVLSLTACAGRPEPNPDAESLPAIDEEVPASSGFLFANPLPFPGGPPELNVVNTGFSKTATEWHGENDDTIGWLRIEDTTIDDVVLWYPGDRNEFYLRRNFQKQDDWYGSYFADYRSTFNGNRTGLAKNTVIYGHSMDDNPDGLVFSQLKKYLKADFAKTHPYVYFSTLDEDMAWEVFAVFYATINLRYNDPNPTAADWSNMLTEVLDRSIYDYDVEVSPTDKILTLSTCCYNYTTAYPNNYRYVIMARLVNQNEPLKEEATFAVNPSPKAP